MHTSSYNRVIEKFQLSGREYLDGFSSADFVGLSSEERVEIRNILFARASHGDNVALGAIELFLSEDQYIGFLEKLISEQDENKLFYAQLAAAICKVRGVDHAWDRIINCLSSGDASARRWVALRLSDLSVPENMYPRLRSALQDLIQRERDKVILLMAAGALLKLCGIPPKTKVYTDFFRSLQSQDQIEKNEALMHLEKMCLKRA